MSIAYDQLSTSQKRVVSHSANKLLVLAGPGTGKTEVLTHRMIHLINSIHALPQEILAVTFSRKAAKEMKDRISTSLGDAAEDIRISTLHAESLRILGGAHSAAKFFVSDEEARMLMQDAIDDSGLSGSVRLRDCQAWVRLRKAQCVLPAEIVSNDNSVSNMKGIYARYEELLEFNRASDLDGLVLRVLRVLPKIREETDPTSYIKHLLVDEFQDINEGERQLIHLLSQHASTIFAVGDDDQSIYSWRGADPAIIRNFAADFTGQVEILQESNRCTDHILQGAKVIVANASGYIPKSLISARGAGEPIRVLSSSSENSEAFWIAREIKRKVSAGEWSLARTAVICKRLDLADPLASRLRREGINNILWAPKGVTTDESVSEIMGYLRVLVDQSDNLAIRRRLEAGSRTGVGRKGVAELRHLAESKKKSLWSTIQDAANYQALRRWRSALLRFSQTVETLIAQTPGLNPPQAISKVVQTLKMRHSSAIINLIQIATSLSELSLSAFVDEVQKNRSLDLAGGASEPATGDSHSLSIMSMHASKGLTFDTVFVLGMDNGILPDFRGDDGEQRRLLFVAMTRARNQLYLCHARRRIIGGKRFYNPSHFLSEIPPEHLSYVKT